MNFQRDIILLYFLAINFIGFFSCSSNSVQSSPSEYRFEIEEKAPNRKVESNNNSFYDPFFNPYLNSPTPMEIPLESDQEDITQMKNNHNRKVIERNRNEEIKNTPEYLRWQKQNNRLP